VRELSLHVDRLVVHGLPGMRAADLEGAVVAELTRLLQDDGLPPGLSDGSAGRRVAPSVRVAAGADAGTFGTDVARAVYRSLSASDRSRASVGGPGAPTSGPG